MSRSIDLGLSAVPAVDWYTVRKAEAVAAFYFYGDLSSSNITADIRSYPDAPGAALATPSVSVGVQTNSRADWISLGIELPADLGEADSDAITVSTVTLTLSSGGVAALPRLNPRGEKTELSWSVGDASQRLLAGKFVIVETA
jgi:hypothetical protein